MWRQGTQAYWGEAQWETRKQRPRGLAAKHGPPGEALCLSPGVWRPVWRLRQPHCPAGQCPRIRSPAEQPASLGDLGSGSPCQPHSLMEFGELLSECEQLFLSREVTWVRCVGCELVRVLSTPLESMRRLIYIEESKSLPTRNLLPS